MLENFEKQVVLVIGDMMVDKYILGSVERISPEAPVPILRQDKTERKLGGAGNVIMNAVSLGATVRAIGRIGMDSEGNFFRKCLQDLGVDDRYIVEEGNTIVKTRVSASNQQFIRIDEETVAPPSEKTMRGLIANLDNIFQGITVVIISDYAKGILTETLTQAVIQKARETHTPVFIDPKGKSAVKYKGATALTPNSKEFMDLTGLNAIPDEECMESAALQLCDTFEFGYVIVTRSEKGISIIDRIARKKRDYPAVVKELIDVTGAGDTVVTTIALGMGAGIGLDECVKIANVAASIVISKFGAAQTTVSELNAALFPSEKISLDQSDSLREISRLKSCGKRIVFTNGCFDLVHAGHISSFLQARSLGDILVVGVNSDESIRRIKGDARPVVDLQNRIALLSALECVDFVIPFTEDTPQRLIEEICPDVLVKGKDWEGKEIAGGSFVRAYGGQVVFIELEQGLSTTNIIQKIQRTMG